LSVNISSLIAEATVSAMSFGDGQMSLRNTSLPSGSVPSASVAKSKSMVPASA